ncbi:hypothetical protein PR048_011712 [Dryococelus australis]|uniref:Uncharacterized protein n=1 Tax=Dryococelus australis TaxID=614101 RepID=A0ABQ9HMD2_9NEOP|nr:hypothetical protein PR048_011712 [Dryococelus australis]
MSINVLTALHFIARAWSEVKVGTIQNCFEKTGFPGTETGVVLEAHEVISAESNALSVEPNYFGNTTNMKEHCILLRPSSLKARLATHLKSTIRLLQIPVHRHAVEISSAELSISRSADAWELGSQAQPYFSPYMSDESGSGYLETSLASSLLAASF